MTIARFPVLPALLAVLACLLLSAPKPLAAGRGGPVAWVELGPGGSAIARVITPDSSCPSLSLANGEIPMQARGEPADNYPLLVCEAGLPPDAASASVDGLSLPVPSPHPARILVLGDTGCRLKLEDSRETIQACNDLQAWPDETIAGSAAAWKPDLIIHVGDYLYREAPCPDGNAGCAGSPWGYNWGAWNADFFAPEAALLRSAPWVFVRGDHELCERAGEGWFRFLDPTPLQPGCQNYTEPYAIAAGDLRLLMLDSANADDYQAIPDEVTAYTEQFDRLTSLVQPGSWLLTHRPVWVFGHLSNRGGTEQLFRDNPTLQAASPNGLPSGISLVLSGHIHLFESLAFAGSHPPQLVIGNGGTALDPDITSALTGMQIGGETVTESSVVDQFGYMTIEPDASGWVGTLRDVDGGPVLTCAIQPAGIGCTPAG